MTARLAIICTHPIQYNVPVFQNLAQRDGLQIRVFFGWEGATADAFDHGFGQQVRWDIPLLDGYDFEFVENVSADPGSHRFGGIHLPTLEQRLRDWGPSAVLIYGWAYKSHLRIMRRLKGKIPIYFRGDSTLLSEQPGVRRLLRRRLLRWVYKHIDIAFYVGTQNREYFLKHGLRDDQLVFAPHAVDNARFGQLDPAPIKEIRETLGIGTNDLMLLFSGKLEPIKAVDQLLFAFREVVDEHVHLVVAGSGPMEPSLRQIAGRNVHFLGFQNQSQMPAFYGAADVLALPSRSDTWGLAINEAMAARCAILTSDRVGAAVDLVQPGINGWLTKAGDLTSLKEKLQAIVATPHPAIRKMGERSFQMIQDWSIDAQSKAIGETACHRSI